MNENLYNLTTTEYATNPVTLPGAPAFAALFLIPPGSTLGQKMLPGTYNLKGNTITFETKVEGTLDVLWA